MRRLEIENMTKQELKELIRQSVPAIVKAVVAEIRKDGFDKKERFLTMVEVIPLLDMKKAYIRVKCREGILPHYKRGTKYFFLYSEISNWIQEGKIKTIAEESAELTARIKKRL